MENFESRLNAATPCGVVRDGQVMTLVRLADVQTLVGFATINRDECAALLKRNEELRDEKDRLAARLSDLEGRITRVVNALN